MKWMSVWDMCRIPEVKDILLADDLTETYNLLYDVGFDINKEIYVESCYHRTIYKEVVYAPRFVGEERLDDSWINSGYASEEAWKILVGKKDVSLLRLLEEMSKESNFTGEITEHLSNYWGSGSEMTRCIEVSL
ncbi:MAG: hypothetical protein M0R77_07625 [Gammaproteobacteria bacterium]|nr:hypothetical protein [Gammaproteobacteria bacterium]